MSVAKLNLIASWWTAPLDISYRSQKHIKVLDGIRGLAIVMVLAFHFFAYFHWASFGWIGVNLFFLLSGFLITGILLDSRHRKNYYRTFIVRRTLRIFPLYYLFLLMIFLVIPYVTHPSVPPLPGLEYLLDNQLWFWTYAQNWLAVVSQHWPEKNALSHFWSLAIEEQFYLFWPAVVYFLSKRRLFITCIALIFVSLSLRICMHALDFNWFIPYVSTITRFDDLCLGSMLAILVRSKTGIEFLNYFGKWFFAVAAISMILIAVLFENFYINNPLIHTFIACLFAGMLIISLSNHKSNPIRAALESRVLSFFGKYSYGIYIYHMLIYFVLEWAFADRFPEYKIIISLAGVVLSMAVAVVSYHAFERHFLKLKDQLTTLKPDLQPASQLRPK